MNQKTIPNKDNLIITIEFNPQVYSEDTESRFSQPLFVFGDWVIIANCNERENKYRICAMELICPSDIAHELTSNPFWKYGVREPIGTRELVWFAESELARFDRS